MITQHEDLLIIGLEPNTTNLKIIYQDIGIPCLTGKVNGKWAQCPLPKEHKWQLIGQYPGLSEEQAAQRVESLTPEFNLHPHLYRNYRYGKPQPIGFTCASSIKSFSSLMDHLRLYTVNPYQATPPTTDMSFYDSEEDYEKCLSNWRRAQARTFSSFVVLKRQ